MSAFVFWLGVAFSMGLELWSGILAVWFLASDSGPGRRSWLAFSFELQLLRAKRLQSALKKLQSAKRSLNCSSLELFPGNFSKLKTTFPSH